MDALIVLILKYRYFALFPLAAFEGPIISVVVGFLVSLGHFDFFPAYVVLIFGDLIPDTVYYYIGRLGDSGKLMQKYGSKFGILSKHFPLVEKLWRDHGKKTMFFSKLAYGLSTPFLISAGLVKMSYRRFISYALPVTLFQYAVLLTVGYYLGNSYITIAKYFKYAELVIAGAVVIFILAYLAFYNYAKKEISELENEELNESK